MSLKFINPIVLLLSLLFFGCAKETITPQTSGNIKGRVQNSSTGKGLPAVSISTNPGTNVILTDSDGHFSLNNIPTGNYVVKASKNGFQSKSVNVGVEDNKTATAQILLMNSDSNSASSFIKAQVSNYFNHSSHDSSFVDVNYRVKNDSNSKSVPKFEVYFKIYTANTIFYAQVKGDTLDVGQQNIGTFTKYIHQASADSVVVSDIYAKTQ